MSAGPEPVSVVGLVEKGNANGNVSRSAKRLHHRYVPFLQHVVYGTPHNDFMLNQLQRYADSLYI